MFVVDDDDDDDEDDVVCLQLTAGLLIDLLLPLPFTVSCFSQIQLGFAYRVLAHPGSPGQRPIIWVLQLLFIIFYSNHYYAMISKIMNLCHTIFYYVMHAAI